MKAGTVSTRLHVVRAKRSVHSEKSLGSAFSSTAGEDEMHRAEEQSLIKRGVRAAKRWPLERNARIEELRSLIRDGRYQIDGKAIAECLLNNETHFV